jgi:hypothetical protein
MMTIACVLVPLALFVATFIWTAKAASKNVPKPPAGPVVSTLDSPCLNKG